MKGNNKYESRSAQQEKEEKYKYVQDADFERMSDDGPGSLQNEAVIARAY